MKKHLFSLLAMLTAFGTSAFALDQINGVYQIGTAADLKAFAELVNGGNYTANAILTADIDKGNDGTKIAQSGEYQGIFDGAGHTITINLTDTETQGPALFRSIGNRGIVQNLKVQGTIKTSKQHAAGIANYSAALIRNCFADLKFELSGLADASAAGIVGQLNRPAIIENCLSKVVITGADSHKCGGLAAWVDANRINIANCLVINDDCSFDISDGKSAGLVRDGDGKLKFVNLSTYNADSYKNRPEGANANNYVTNDWGVLSLGTTVVTPQEVASGKVCYQLNSDLRLVIEDHFENVSYEHLMQDVWTQSYQQNRHGKRNRLFAHLHDRRLEAFCFDANRFRFCNSFEINDNRDAAYFLLAVWKQLAFDSQSDGIYLSFDPVQSAMAEMQHERQSLADTLRRYVKNVHLPEN